MNHFLNHSHHFNQQNNPTIFSLLRHEREHAYNHHFNTCENCCFDRPDVLQLLSGELFQEGFVDAKGGNDFFGNPTLFSFCSFFPAGTLNYEFVKKGGSYFA